MSLHPTISRSQNGQYHCHLHHLLQAWLLQLALLQPTKYSTKPYSAYPEFSCTCCCQSPKVFHINPALKSLHWRKIKQHIYYKILSLTYTVLTTTQPSYLYNLISVHPHCSTRSSDIITLSCPPSCSSPKFNNCSFHHASPCLWNQLPKELYLPTDHEDLSLSSDLTHVSLSFPLSPLSPSIIPSHFHSRFKTHLFHKSFPP